MKGDDEEKHYAHHEGADYSVYWGPGVIEFKSGYTWMMRIKPNHKVDFNREAFPDMAADDFAKEVISMLEEMFVVGGPPPKE